MTDATRCKQALWNYLENLYWLDSGVLSPVTFQRRNFWWLLQDSLEWPPSFSTTGSEIGWRSGTEPAYIYRTSIPSSVRRGTAWPRGTLPEKAIPLSVRQNHADLDTGFGKGKSVRHEWWLKRTCLELCSLTVFVPSITPWQPVTAD